MYGHEKNLEEERAELRASMKAILDKQGRGERLSFDERRSLNRSNERIGAIEAELRDLKEARGRSAASADGIAGPAGASAEERAFTRYLRWGLKDMAPEDRAAMAAATETRAAGEGTNTAGGYLVPPGWWQRLQVSLKAFGGTSADFQLLETETGQPMQWATVDPTAIVGTLIAENTQVADVDYTFGQGTLGAYLYSSGVQKVSFQLAHDSAFDISDFVAARVGESLGRAQAAAAISGTGASQPLGIITALNAKGNAGSVGSSALAATGGFVSLNVAQKVQQLSYTPATAGTDSSLTEIQSNALSPATVLSMVRAVDPAYRALGAKFYMNDYQITAMKSLLDGFGRPFWPTLWEPEPTLSGYPVVIDNNIPNLAASTTGGPIFGHVQSAMVLRRVNQAGLLRLDQRYADFLQIGYIGYMRLDIRSNDLRAAVTVKPSAT